MTANDEATGDYILWTTPDGRPIQNTPAGYEATLAHHRRMVDRGINFYSLIGVGGSVYGPADFVKAMKSAVRVKGGQQ